MLKNLKFVNIYDKLHTLKTENLSGAIIFRKFSIASKLDIDLPVTVGGNDTDMLNLAFGLRYKLCGKYNGTQSDTCLIVCIFIIVLISNYCCVL